MSTVQSSPLTRLSTPHGVSMRQVLPVPPCSTSSATSWSSTTTSLLPLRLSTTVRPPFFPLRRHLLIRRLLSGKTFGWAKAADLSLAVETIKYYAGWADKIQGNVIETTEDKLAYTRHEPIGVVGQILPWNFPRTSPSVPLFRTLLIDPRS